MISDQEWVKIVCGLVGKPFQWNARGPDAYDCWGLVITARQAVGLDTPNAWSEWLLSESEAGVNGKESCMLMEAQIERPVWLRVDNPTPGDIVVMSTHKLIHHVGLYTPFGVLNTTRQMGVTVDTLFRLRDLGYKRIEYYQWVG